MAASAAAGAAQADQVVTRHGVLDGVSVAGIEAGRLIVKDASGRARALTLGSITSLQLSGMPAFNRAEERQALGQWRQAAADYDRALHQMNDETMRRVALARSIRALDECGRWTDAVARFLELAMAQPAAGTFELVPTHMPEAGSQMLDDSAAQINKALEIAPFATDAAAARRLRGLLLRVYNQADDPRAAQVARQLTAAADAADEGRAHTGVSTTAPGAASALDGVAQAAELALRNGRYDDAQKIATDGLPTAAVGTAARLRMVLAAVAQQQNRPDDAVAEWLKVVVFEPHATAAPQALWRAASLQEKQGQTAAARRLYERLVKDYATSAEAGRAREKLKSAETAPATAPAAAS